jgi:hypothetical protein
MSLLSTNVSHLGLDLLTIVASLYCKEAMVSILKGLVAICVQHHG